MFSAIRGGVAGQAEEELSVITSWRHRTGIQDTIRLTDLALEGWDGGSWIPIDNFDPTDSLDTWETRTNGVDFTHAGGNYTNFRLSFTNSSAGANMSSEVEIYIEGTDITVAGTSPTSVPSGAPYLPANLFDKNTSTQYPDNANGDSSVVTVNPTTPIP